MVDVHTRPIKSATARKSYLTQYTHCVLVHAVLEKCVYNDTYLRQLVFGVGEDAKILVQLLDAVRTHDDG